MLQVIQGELEIVAAPQLDGIYRDATHFFFPS